MKLKKTKKQPNGINQGCFELQLSQNVAKSILNITSQSCNFNFLSAVCFSRQDGAIYRPSKHSDVRQAKELSLSKNRSFVSGNSTHVHIVYCYIHQVVVKSEH